MWIRRCKQLNLMPKRAASLALAAFLALARAGDPVPSSGAPEDPLPPGAVVRLGVSRFKVGYPTGNLCFSSDGKAVYALTGSAIRGWEIPSGRPVKSPDPAKTRPNALYMAQARAEGRVVGLLFGRGPLQNCRLWVRDVLKDKDLFTVEVSEIDIPGVTLSADGRILAVPCRRENAIHLWDVHECKKLSHVPGTGEKQQLKFALSPDGRTLGLVDQQPTGTSVRLFEVKSGKELSSFIIEHGRFTDVAFSMDGKILAGYIVDSREPIILYALPSGDALQQLASEGTPNGRPAFSPDGKMLAAGEMKGVRLYNTATGEARFLEASGGKVVGPVFSPDGKHLAAISGIDVCVWNLESGKLLVGSSDHGGSVTDIAFSGDGKTVVTGSGDGSVRLWDAAKGREIRSMQTGGRSVSGVAFSPDGKQIAVIDMSRTTRMLDANSGGELFTSEANQGMLMAVAYSSDGKRFATGSIGGIVVRDAANGKEQLKLFQGQCSSLAFSSDGSLLAGFCEGSTSLPDSSEPPEDSLDAGGIELNHYSIRLWSSTGKEKLRFKVESQQCGQIAFSPDGRMLFLGDGSNVRAWELTSGQPLFTFGKGEWTRLGKLASSPDGRILATVAQERIGLWDPFAGEILQSLQVPGAEPTCIAFSSDGKRLAVGTSDSTSLIWDVAAQGLSGAAATSKELSAAELDHAWEDLGTAADKAFAAVRKLCRSPSSAVPFLKGKLQQAKTGRKDIQRWLSELDADGVEVREKAAAGLEGLGWMIKPLLEKALAGTLSAESRQRIQDLLGNIGPVLASPEVLRTSRAIWVLERIGTEGAKDVLKRLASEEPEGLAYGAGDALRRLGRR